MLITNGIIVGKFERKENFKVYSQFFLLINLFI